MAEREAGWHPPVRVTASSRRRRTVAARFVDGVLEVRVPAWMGTAERARWAERMRARIERQGRRAGPTDGQLERRGGGGPPPPPRPPAARRVAARAGARVRR